MRLRQVEQAFALQVPLDVDRAALKGAGAEAAVKSLPRGRHLELDVEDLLCDPLPEVPRSHGPLDDPGELGVQAVALGQDLGHLFELTLAHRAIVWASSA